nr:unnamed protein product [Digitaria exilis]
MAALVVSVNPQVKFSDDKISAILDEVFRTYGPTPSSSSLPGLLRTYDDGSGDVDRDHVNRLGGAPPPGSSYGAAPTTASTTSPNHGTEEEGDPRKKDAGVWLSG